MASELNLRVAKTKQGVEVSWRDLHKPDAESASWVNGFTMVWSFAIFFGFIGTVASLSPWPLVIALVFAFFIWRMQRGSIYYNDKKVIFGRDKIWASGHWYAGGTVTRFELTTGSATTGNTPKKTSEGRVMIDPYVIRMWVNDSHATTVATNAWTMDVNHKIRDTLEKTWMAWKDQRSKKDEQKEFGDVSTETGMPDY